MRFLTHRRKEWHRSVSCGAFLMSRRCKLACIRWGSEKAQEGRRPGMPFYALQGPSGEEEGMSEGAARRNPVVSEPLWRRSVA